jgi:hypothetical protein
VIHAALGSTRRTAPAASAGLRPEGQIGPSRFGAAGGEVKIDWERDAPRLECGLRRSDRRRPAVGHARPRPAGMRQREESRSRLPCPQASALNIHDTTVTEQA